mmetsp:Transcript_165/g.513  ORF Transcript_165/g.513 Transcript_165/m.513 type:complete len:297 (+) Transcript_165:65-955(+)
MAENGESNGHGEADLVSQNKKLLEKIRAHEGYAAKVKGAYSELSTMYNKLRDDYASFVKRHNDITKVLEETRVKNEERISELEATVDEVKVAREEAEAEAKKLLEDSLAERDGNLSAVRKDLERASEMNLELMKASEQVDQLRDELEETRTAREELEERVLEQENDMRLTKDELWKMMHELEDLLVEDTDRSDSGADDEDVKSVPTELSDTLQKLAELRVQVREKMTDLREAATNADERTDQLRSEKQDLEATINNDENVDDLLKMLVKAKTDVAESENIRLQLQQELTRLKKMRT